MNNASLFTRAKNLIAKHYGDAPGKMLVHTGVIGWILSSAAQVCAISINDKIPKEQKMYLITQEIADYLSDTDIIPIKFRRQFRVYHDFKF